MANIKGGIKRAKQALQNRTRNRGERKRVHTVESNLLAALSANDKVKSKELYRLFCSFLDKSLKHGVMKANTVSRKKSRLAARLVKLA